MPGDGGDGLSHLFEPPTLPSKCPTCQGCGFSSVEQFPKPFAMYWRVVVCADCNGAGLVAPVKLAEIRQRTPLR